MNDDEEWLDALLKEISKRSNEAKARGFDDIMYALNTAWHKAYDTAERLRKQRKQET